MPLDHYISQVHLRNFYSPALGERMYAIRKSDLKCFTPNSESVCRIEEGNTNKYLTDERAIEEFLKTIEPNYNSSIESLKLKCPDDLSIYTISGFVSYVAACSPTGMRLHSAPLKNTLEATTKSLDARGLLPSPPPELGGKNLTELLESGAVNVTVDPKYPQAIGLSLILESTATFGNFKWDILHNPFDDNPFFTSDFPVAVEQSDDPRILNRVVSLSPDVAVRIFPDISYDRRKNDFSFSNFRYRLREIGHGEVVHLNRLFVRCAEDTVFYRHDKPWVVPFVKRNKNYRIEPVTENIPTPTGTLMFSTLRVMQPPGEPSLP